jgi:hypothetical protein
MIRQAAISVTEDGTRMLLLNDRQVSDVSAEALV